MTHSKASCDPDQMVLGGGRDERLDHLLARMLSVSTYTVIHAVGVQHEEADPARDVERPELRGLAIAVLAVVAVEPTARRAVGVITPRAQQRVRREVGDQQHPERATQHERLGALAVLKLTGGRDQGEQPGPPGLDALRAKL